MDNITAFLSILTTVLPLLATGGFLGIFIKHFLDSRYARKLEEHNRKRAVYENLITTLSIFISGRTTSDEYRESFLDTYSKCWLWASDDVVKKIGDFIDYQIKFAAGDKVDQDEMKRKYARCVIAMRKDLGFAKTDVDETDYKFVSF